MNNISQTLNCKNIYNNRIANNLPVYDGRLGSNSVRQPNFFIESLKKFSDQKDYVSVRGIDELQKTLKSKYSNDLYKVDSVIVGNGLKELLFLLQLCFVNMTNGLIFHITPSWVSYKEQILILNKESNLVEIETTIDNMFKVKPEQLELELSKFQNQNKMIIFNNPNNPTGVLYTPDEVEEISKIIKKYNCIVLADEIYFNITHNRPIVSISKYIPDLTIIGNSVSKDMGCGGYRIGWLTFPKNLSELSNKCEAYGSSIYSCAPTPLQYATNEMLKN
jgi:aspartate/methionine/tyrosine aminotransferase